MTLQNGIDMAVCITQCMECTSLYYTKPRNASKVLPEINETKYPCDDKCSLIAGIVKPYNGRNTNKGRNS